MSWYQKDAKQESYDKVSSKVVKCLGVKGLCQLPHCHILKKSTKKKAPDMSYAATG